MKPDSCTSLYCSPDETSTDYCLKCNHAIWFGSGKDRNGKLWQWEYTPLYGPLFVGKRGEPLARQPIQENHRAWEPFEKWKKAKFRR